MGTKSNELTNAVLSCLFAALISLGAFVALPFPGTPIPIVLQNLFILIAASTLGPFWGLFSVSIYLAFGLIGLPVFSGGTGGLTKFLGPTGGYLVGYLPAAFIVGFFADRGKTKFFPVLLGSILGMAVVYCFGVAWLKLSLELDWGRALASGLLPFLPGDLAKILLASILAPKIKAGIIALDVATDV